MIARSSCVLHRASIKNFTKSALHVQISHSYSQHSSYDHWVLSLEIVRHADGEHFHRGDLATTPAARSAVHVWVSCDEELSQLVHEFARRGTTALHEAGVVGVRGDQLWPTSRRETRCAQVIVCGKVTVELPRRFRLLFREGSRRMLYSPRSRCPIPSGGCPLLHCCFM